MEQGLEQRSVDERGLKVKLRRKAKKAQRREVAKALPTGGKRRAVVH